jgi:hypothetical protein
MNRIDELATYTLDTDQGALQRLWRMNIQIINRMAVDGEVKKQENIRWKETVLVIAYIGAANRSHENWSPPG